MQTHKIGINNISFKANYFTVEKKGQGYSLIKVSTDNEENLGQEPTLEFNSTVKKYELPMAYDGKYYTTYVFPETDKYRIFYKDTGKYEKNAKEQTINRLELVRIAAKEDKKNNNLSDELAYSKGVADGKVVIAKFEDEKLIADIPKDEPTILLIDGIDHYNVFDLLELPKNVKGVIASSCEFEQLSHYASWYRNNLSVMSVILDENKYNELKNQEGNFISVDNQDGILNWKEIEPISTIKDSEVNFIQKVEVPKLKKVEKLLMPEELTPQNCGNKGYRLSIMQQLVNQGKLKDISIPKYFVIPEGYINNLKEYLGEEETEEYNDKLFYGIYTQEVDKKVEELGMDKRDLIVRSNYNTEDLSSFSSAEIYNSQMNKDDCILNTVLNSVIKRESESEFTQYVHKQNGIENKQVQPSVIVQDYVSHDYSFNLYSDDGDNNVIIDLIDFSQGPFNAYNSLIKYNKKTKELTIERAESPNAEYVINEKGKIIDSCKEECPIYINWNALAPILGTVTSGAMVLEQFFKHPQDIEGGITNDGKVYFWQTRDIVAKAKKKI